VPAPSPPSFLAHWARSGSKPLADRKLRSEIPIEHEYKSGRFSGSGVEGAYSVGSSEITITITKKPFIALESIVRKKITGYFKE
jgi:hypothetical protein